MAEKTYNVLFICTGNSARSIIAESLLNSMTGGPFRAFSAGSHPKGEVHPLAIQELHRLHIPTEGLRSKSWEEFAQPGAPEMDFVFTLCDQAAGEVCPVWPGQPLTAHWGMPDPAAVEGTEEQKLKAFKDVAVMMKRRLDIMMALPLEGLGRLAIQKQVRDIGAMTTNVLILCTHNSARSVLSEGMLNHWARKLGKDVRAYSAGSAPSGRINPYALEALSNAGVSIQGYRSKSWDEFTEHGAPQMRIVITVCDSAAAEQCPYWPGSPVKVHWGYPDPSNAPEPDKKNAFELTRQAIGYRILQLLQLPLESMSNAELQAALLDISNS